MKEELFLKQINLSKERYRQSTSIEKQYLVNDLYWLDYFYRNYFDKKKDILSDIDDYFLYLEKSSDVLKKCFLYYYEKNRSYYQNLFFQVINLYDLYFPFEDDFSPVSSALFSRKEIDEIISQFCASYSSDFYLLYKKHLDKGNILVEKKISNSRVYYFNSLKEGIIQIKEQKRDIHFLISLVHELGHLFENSIQSISEVYYTSGTCLYEVSSSFFERLFLDFLETQHIDPVGCTFVKKEYDIHLYNDAWNSFIDTFLERESFWDEKTLSFEVNLSQRKKLTKKIEQIMGYVPLIQKKRSLCFSTVYGLGSLIALELSSLYQIDPTGRAKIEQFFREYPEKDMDALEVLGWKKESFLSQKVLTKHLKKYND